MKELLAECLGIPSNTIESWVFEQNIEASTDREWQGDQLFLNVKTEPWEPQYRVSIINQSAFSYVTLEELFTKLYERTV